MKIGKYEIKKYKHGYELHTPYSGEKHLGGGRVEIITKHRVTYHPSLKLTCEKLLDTEMGKCESVEDLLGEMQACTKRIEAAIKDMGVK